MALINPQVLADLLEADFGPAIKITPFARVATLTQGGNVVTLPKWEYIGDAEVKGQGEAFDTAALSQTSTNVEVIKVGKAVKISDEERHFGYGDVVEEARKQIVRAVANKIEKQAVAELDKATLTHEAGKAAMDIDVVIEALEKFGENVEEPMTMFINPKDLVSLRKDPNFINKNTDSRILGGVGEIYGVRVVISAQVAEGTVYIMRDGALGLFDRTGTVVETDRNVLTKEDVIVAHKFYAVYLADESKAIKVTLA